MFKNEKKKIKAAKSDKELDKVLKEVYNKALRDVLKHEVVWNWFLSNKDKFVSSAIIKEHIK